MIMASCREKMVAVTVAYVKKCHFLLVGVFAFVCQIRSWHHHHSHPSWWGSVSCYSVGASFEGPSVVVGRCVVLLPPQRTWHASRRVCARTKRNSVAAAELAEMVVGVAPAAEQDCLPPGLLRLVHVALPMLEGMDVLVVVLVLMLGWLLPVDAVCVRAEYFDTHRRRKETNVV